MKRTQSNCPRCGGALNTIDAAAATRFFECPSCHRHYRLTANSELVDRWLGPISLVIYPIIYSRHPQDDVERVVKMFSERFVPPAEHRDVLEEESVEAHRQKVKSIVDDIRAELAKPTQRVRDILNLQFRETVSEQDVREFLQGVADGLARWQQRT